ncbi:TapB family protein [Marinifilum sp. RC60d5]|uniref:TapB family protein n=1 Tax=Marinifilum sp. RC60d5 TaxID=3458414 RepID=UPI00403572D6
MKKLFSMILLMFSACLLAISQDCTIYIPSDIGTELHFQTSNAKGKIQGIYSQKVISVKNIGGETHYDLLQTHRDPKNQEKIIIQDTISFRCKGNVFYIDMEKYLNQKQMEGFKGMEVKITTNDLIYPSNLSPGMALNDGSISLQVGSGIMNMTTNIINRKVEAHENITTAAGTFKCYKISEDVKSKMGFITVQLHNVSWIVKNIGTIRSESYNKKGKLDSTTELIKIVK